MSCSARWRRPVHQVLAKVLEAHGAKLGAAIDENLEAFADFDEYPLDAETLEFSIGLLGRELSEPASITIDSNDAQNRSCWMALGNIAGELSMKLGGPDEPEPN